MHFLDYINQPSSCEFWGEHGAIDIPDIADGTSITNISDNSLITELSIIEWFAPKPGSSGTPYPVTIFINHDMQIQGIYYTSLSIDDVNYIIRNMLDDI